MHVIRHFFRVTKAGSLRRCFFSKIYSSAVPKGFLTPSNFSFNSSNKIWTKICALLGYKLPSPNVKGEVQGAKLLAGVTHRAMFRAICLEVVLWHPLCDKLFGGIKRSKTEKRFLQLMSHLCQQEWSERLRYKTPAQGFRLNILILKAKTLKDTIWRNIAIMFGALHNFLKTENVKLQQLNESTQRNERKYKKRKQTSHGNWRLDPCAVSQKIISVVDLTLTVY